MKSGIRHEPCPDSARIAMNIFELSLIATPIAGALTGGSAAGIAGAGAGLAIGLALYGMVAGLSALLSRRSATGVSSREARQKGLRSASSLAQAGLILALCALPFASWKLTALAVALGQPG